MTTERMLRTRRSASRLVSSSIWRSAAGRVVAHLVLELLHQDRLGLRGRQARGALELAHGLLADLDDLRLLLGQPALALGELGRRGRRAPPRGRADAPRGASSRRGVRPSRGRRARAARVPWRGPPRPSPPPGASRAGQPRPPGPGPPRPPRSRFPLPFLSPAPLPEGCGASSITGLRRRQAEPRLGRAEETSRKAAADRPPRQMAAVMRCWVGSAGRARPDAVPDRPRGWFFLLAVVTEAAASA